MANAAIFRRFCSCRLGGALFFGASRLLEQDADGRVLGLGLGITRGLFFDVVWHGMIGKGPNCVVLVICQ